MKRFPLIAACVACVAVSGCLAGGRSNLTPGSAKRHLRPGVTHQAEVVQVFGPPNIVTFRDGGEMWVYDKVSSHQANSAFAIGGMGGGIATAGAGGGLIGFGASGSSRSETTVMLIVYYDQNDVVADYKFTQTKF